MNFGEKLKQLRGSKNWSQPELAKAIGIEQSYLSKLENDKSIPSPEMLNRILETLHISIDELLSGIDDAEIRSQLSAIPQVVGHIQHQENLAVRNSNRWLLISSLCLALGISATLAGGSALLFPEPTYNYHSTEIVPRGANGEIFESLEVYIEYKFAPIQSELLRNQADSDEIEMAQTLLSLQYANLNTQEFILSYKNNGIVYTTELDSESDWQVLNSSGIEYGATRTFALQRDLISPPSQPRTENGILSTIGMFLLMLGSMGFLTRISRFIANYMLHRRQS